MTRLAKKRRDDKRDSSTVKRVLKAGGTVLAVGAGAALFSRSSLFEKGNKLIPALMETGKSYNRSMYGKKRTAMNMYNAFEKSIGKDGKVFRETLARQSTKINPITGRMTNVLGRTKNIRQTPRSKIVKEFTKERAQQARAGVLESVLKNKKFEKYDKEALERIV